mgnify:CR=1 FL=1
MSDITGIHHITAICGDAQENLDFYTGVLGMRLVKKSVNQDDPGHVPSLLRRRRRQSGNGSHVLPVSSIRRRAARRTDIGVEIALAIPAGSHEYWQERLAAARRQRSPATETRRGDRAIVLVDPHGQLLALVETSDERMLPRLGQESSARRAAGRRPARRARAGSAIARRPPSFLTGVLRLHRTTARRTAGTDTASTAVDPGKHIELREMPNSTRGAWGVGTMHHVAWRVADDAVELAVRERIAAGASPADRSDRPLLVQVGLLPRAGRRPVRARDRRPGLH